MVWILVNLVSLLPGAGPQLCGRRAALLGAAAFAAGGSRNARADTAVPTFTLKGIPGIAAITGSDAPRPGELGVIAKGADGSKSGRLQFCDKKGCITSFGLPEDEGYIPPWTYAPEELRTTSVNDARRAALRAQLAAEGGDSVSRPARKTLETAQGEMRTMLASVDGCLIVKDEPRYFLLEFEDPISGAHSGPFLWSSGGDAGGGSGISGVVELRIQTTCRAHRACLAALRAAHRAPPRSRTAGRRVTCGARLLIGRRTCELTRQGLLLLRLHALVAQSRPSEGVDDLLGFFAPPTPLYLRLH